MDPDKRDNDDFESLLSIGSVVVITSLDNLHKIDIILHV